jgi:hypothetical protein
VRARFYYQEWLGGNHFGPWKVGFTDDRGIVFVPPYSIVFIETGFLE